MKTAHDIILKPVITENSMAGIADKKYTFKVALQGQHHLCPRSFPPSGYACWLHRRFQEGDRDPDQGLQGDRVLQQHGLIEPAEGSSMGI